MLKFEVITIFPNIFKSYLTESFIKKAQESKKIKVGLHNLRDFTTDKHKAVDDRPFGGGLGMVMKPEPVFKAVNSLVKLGPKLKNKDKKTKIILFTPRGKKFDQQLAYKLAKLNKIVFICGRYEGVDERVAKHLADLELSVGDYDLMGGELPAMIVMETITRLIPGVLGKPSLLKERVTKDKRFIEYPQYTRPEVFCPKKDIKWAVPKVLLSGDHKKIEAWRKGLAKDIGS